MKNRSTPTPKQAAAEALWQSAGRVRLSAFVSPEHPTECSWILWVDQDGEGHGFDQLWAGRVPLDDDLIMTAHGVLEQARQKLEPWLHGPIDDPLF